MSAPDVSTLPAGGALALPHEHSSPARSTHDRVRLAVTILDHPDALGQVETQWRELESRCGASAVFQSFDWCKIVWSCQIEDGTGPGFEGRVLVIGNADAPAAIWPLRVRSGPLGRIAGDLTEPYGQYGDILFAPDADLDAVMASAMSALRRLRIDALVVRKVRASSRLHAWLRPRAALTGEQMEAPAVELSSYADFDTYHRSLDSKTRKNLRNYRNRLQRLGTLENVLARGREELSSTITDCFERRASWLEAGGLSSSAFADPLFAKLVARLGRTDLGSLGLRAMRLSLTRPDGEHSDLSLHWGFVHNGVYTAYMAAKNPELDAYSPGRLHLEDLLKACAAEGIHTVDFLAPQMPYKRSFATRSVEIETLALPLTMRGRLSVTGWHGTVRPALKWLAARLPKGVRRVALRAANAGPRTS